MTRVPQAHFTSPLAGKVDREAVGKGAGDVVASSQLPPSLTLGPAFAEPQK